jgi:UDP-3-O-[3-hydroxymyristoyl] N-acetylglucosamine deacetylase
VSLKPEAFWTEIAPARTFGFLQEVQYLQANGLARGGSLDNAVVLDDQGVVNPEGFRFPEECVRHKILDAVGDLALVGMPLWGRLEVGRGSHSLHYSFIRRLMSQEAAWRVWAPAPPAPHETTPPWLAAPRWEGAPA